MVRERWNRMTTSASGTGASATGTHAHVLQRALREVAPSLDIRSTRFTPCPIADTATSYPYVDLVADRLSVVMGGNGKAAKSSDEIGRLGAALIRTGT